ITLGEALTPRTVPRLIKPRPSEGADMTNVHEIFGINTYSYTMTDSAAGCVRRLADQGYTGVEMMMYPGHLWPDLDAAGRRDLRRLLEQRGVRLITLNMPNIDLNVAGASQEMRDYSLGLLSRFV